MRQRWLRQLRLKSPRIAITAGDPAGIGPEIAAACVRQSWRSAEEFNVNTGLWLDALFVQVRRAFS